MQIQPERELEGRVCVVTGAGRGIGAAIADTVAAHGARVAILERDAATGADTAARLTEGGAEARSYELDVVDEDAVVAVAAQVRADFGRVDALVNNAGIAKLGPSMSCSGADFRETLEVNALGVFLCSREFGKAMRDGEGGSIANVSSIAGLVAFPMRLAYGATKAGVAHMTRVLACEWADYGIRVNAIAPGMIETEMLRKTIDQGLIDPETYYRRTPQRRFAKPHEMADVVLYLLSDRSRFVTGQVIASDGGWTAFGWIPWSGNPDAPGIVTSS